MKKSILISFAALSLLFNACKQEGQTGENKLIVHPKHHENAIKGATAYIRFGATELNGTSPSDFDLTINSEKDADSIVIDKLRRGDYYVYCVGYDSTISQVVSGGTHIKLKGRKEETNEDIAVVE